MKKRMLGVGLVALVLAGMVGIVSAVTVTNRQDVITVTLLSEISSTDNGTRTVVPIQDVRVLGELTAALVATAYTPKSVGQMLVATFGSTNYVLMSKGITTNDWVQLKP
jgi:mRNA-degrading endonuclease toxin of MazEF toxin-antitoxin module